MMTLEIKHQEQYSRGELLLRTLFGFIYIVIPHAFLLFFMSIASAILNFLAFWVILFTGRYPQSWFEFQVKYMRWSLRVNARLYNMSDGYPAFGLNADDEHVTFDVTYPEQLSRGSVFLRALFGWLYVLIPHGIILMFYGLAVLFVQFLAWWIVLFTGKYPQSLFEFQVEFLRWNQRVSLFMGYMTDTYPPFSGKRDSELFGTPEPAPAAPSSTETSTGNDPSSSSDGPSGNDEPSDDTAG